jgi:citrate lyase beta subunit
VANRRRCLLFVPGCTPQRFEKAIASGADQICIDLEDAVPAPEKLVAREACIDFFGGGFTTVRPSCEVGIRINAVDSPDGLADLQALLVVGVRPDFLMLPKVANAQAVRRAADLLGSMPLIALIESPGAVFEARSIAAASDTLQALMFGGYDYSVASRVAPRSVGWLWPRSMIAAAAAEAGIAAIDVPSLSFDDLANVELETDEAIALGFTARAAIHPSQVATIQRAFMPTQAAVEHAARVVIAADAAKGGATTVDGKLVDLPIEMAARRVLALAA